MSGKVIQHKQCGLEVYSVVINGELVATFWSEAFARQRLARELNKLRGN